ncbi:MAG: group III truncated hemoglobin [Pseudolabrys sp.]
MNEIPIRLARPDGPLTEEAIGRLVDTFYAKVRVDAELGPVFNGAIADWGPHLETMRRFWSSVMLTSGKYKGNPVAAHQRVPGIEMKMFARWLALFDETCRELFDPPLAAAFGGKARRIAESLQFALFYRPDRPWPPRAS